MAEITVFAALPLIAADDLIRGHSGTMDGESSSNSGKRLIRFSRHVEGSGCSFGKIMRSLSATSVDIARLWVGSIRIIGLCIPKCVFAEPNIPLMACTTPGQTNRSEPFVSFGQEQFGRTTVG
jgi:hypothetical protein